MSVLANGNASFTTVTGGGAVLVSGGTTYIDQLVGASEIVLSGGVASNAIVGSGGAHVVSSGAMASNTTISAGGYSVINAGGSANGTNVSSGGVAYVHGSALGDTIVSGGTEYVSPGGALTGATLSGGFLEIRSGATAGISLITFASGGGRLQLDDSVHFSGSVGGFAVPANIDLRDIAFGSGTTLSYVDSGGSSGTLAVNDGTHSASLLMVGSFTSASFVKQGDGFGGTLITHS